MKQLIIFIFVCCSIIYFIFVGVGLFLSDVDNGKQLKLKYKNLIKINKIKRFKKRWNGYNGLSFKNQISNYLKNYKNDIYTT